MSVTTPLYRAITRELPDHYPFVVANEYISSFIGGWQLPAEKLYEAVHQCLLQRVKALTEKHFGKFSQGGLHANVKCVFRLMIFMMLFSPCTSASSL